MNATDVVELMHLRFKSGNRIPADRAHITKAEWDVLCTILPYNITFGGSLLNTKPFTGTEWTRPSEEPTHGEQTQVQ